MVQVLLLLCLSDLPADATPTAPAQPSLSTASVQPLIDGYLFSRGFAEAVWASRETTPARGFIY